MSDNTKPTLADLARDILAGDWDRLPDGDYSYTDDREWQVTAQLYLDNLADGHDVPEDLLALIAEGMARIDYEGEAFWFSTKHGSADFTDFSDWIDTDNYTARAAMSYVPAGGAA